MYYDKQTDKLYDNEYAMENDNESTNDSVNGRPHEVLFDGSETKLAITGIDHKTALSILNELHCIWEYDKPEFYNGVINNQEWNLNNKNNLSVDIIDEKCPIYIIDIVKLNDMIHITIWRKYDRDVYGGRSITTKYTLEPISNKVINKSLVCIEGH